MTNHNPQVRLQIDPTRCAMIIDSAVVASSDIVNFHFDALSKADLTQPADPADAIFKFNGPELSARQRRTMHENWVLAKAFQDLLRAVRHALEEAHISIRLLRSRHKIGSSSSLAEFLRPFQSRAASLKFPDLLEAVNQNLDQQLEFASAYKSLQLARNCLEHRDGVISNIETKGDDKFVLRIPRMKLFYMRDEAEIEIRAGERVDAGDGRDGVDVLAKLDVRERPISLGDRLSFTATEFNEIAFACHFLGQQLSSKLARPHGQGSSFG